MYLSDYRAQGDESLIDGLRGTINRQLGHYWQGYQGNDLIAVVDMGQVKQINSISLGTLQAAGSSIIFPKQVEYWVSDDNKNFKLVITVNTKVDIKDLKAQTQEFKVGINVKTRYIKVIARQYGLLPYWHKSKGEPSYIFADEITVE